MRSIIDKDFPMPRGHQGDAGELREGKIGVYSLGTGIAKGPYMRSARYLENYYNKYDISFHLADEKNERTWSTSQRLVSEAGLNGWYACVTSRFMLIHDFLESDEDYFILQDLDYVVLNPELNIRNHLPDFVCPNWEYSKEYIESRTILLRKLRIQNEIIREYDPNIHLETLVHICADFIGMSREKVESLSNFYKNDVGVDTSNVDEFVEYFGNKANTLEDVNGVGWKKHLQEEEIFATYIAAKKDKPTNIDRTSIRTDCWWMNSGRHEGQNQLKEVIKLITALKDPRYVFCHFGGCDKLEFFDKIVDEFAC